MPELGELRGRCPAKLRRIRPRAGLPPTAHDFTRNSTTGSPVLNESQHFTTLQSGGRLRQHALMSDFQRPIALAPLGPGGTQGFAPARAALGRESLASLSAALPAREVCALEAPGVRSKITPGTTCLLGGPTALPEPTLTPPSRAGIQPNTLPIFLTGTSLGVRFAPTREGRDQNRQEFTMMERWEMSKGKALYREFLPTLYKNRNRRRSTSAALEKSPRPARARSILPVRLPIEPPAAFPPNPAKARNAFR